ncbi:hypothetical protein [Actinomadura rudentiformis]|uniref:Uncharacterized protein n=1 Tax=Actinomadura rudentiformis TaxID=359158 RepID=A0A6H9ZA34_9ACTN|nr:hypothetical protein [Actinomadura rudentiformis]KAB2352313.1 hypothetical protein F8566_01030 [Actinomadura rudentiformis]
MKTPLRNSISLVFGATAMLATALTTTGAAASTAPPGPTPTATTPSSPAAGHCRVVLDRIRPGEKFSRVVSRTCSADRADLGINAETALMTWYQHASYDGASMTYTGLYGPCDKAGYGVRDVGYYDRAWRYSISSFRVHNNCHWTQWYTAVNYGGSDVKYGHGSYAYVGDFWNDRIQSFLMHA